MEKHKRPVEGVLIATTVGPAESLGDLLLLAKEFSERRQEYEYRFEEEKTQIQEYEQILMQNLDDNYGQD